MPTQCMLCSRIWSHYPAWTSMRASKRMCCYPRPPGTVRERRDLARARDVAVRVAPDLPAVEVNAAAVELCLTNYLSNAIKYSDPAKVERWVEVRSRLQRSHNANEATELVVEVS